MTNTERRGFNDLERAELLRLANARCRMCGGAITLATMEADHVLPHVGGGVTDVMNGQALCRTCNRRKAATMPAPAPVAVFTPRAWQVAAAVAADEAIERTRKAVEMIEAAVGCGKTKHALWRTRTAFDRGWSDFVVVITPTLAIRKQWVEPAADLFGLTLIPGFRPGVDTLDDEANGIAVTFASVCGAADRFRDLVKGRRVTVIVDEIHHAADGNNWGAALNHFLKSADHKVFLSGTPFRFDRDRIAGLDYDEAGYPVPTYRYAYREALADGVLRPVAFPIVDSSITWAQRAAFLYAEAAADKVSESDDALFSKLHPAAVDPRSELGSMLLDAFVAETMVTRAVHPRAAGAAICSDVASATAVRDELKRRGHAAMLIHCYDNAAQDNLARFRDRSSMPFIVAVGMIGEGVDIPRLATMAYLSNKATKMALHQAIGRVLRRTDGESVEAITAKVFVPSFNRFTREVLEFEDAVYDAAHISPAGVIHDPERTTLDDLVRVEDANTLSVVELAPPVIGATGPILPPVQLDVMDVIQSPDFRLHDATMTVGVSGVVYPREVCERVEQWLADHHYPNDPMIRQALLDAFGADEFEAQPPRATKELREIKSVAQRLTTKLADGDPIKRAALVEQVDAATGATLLMSDYRTAERRVEILQGMDAARNSKPV
jgi:superfamily II DNA or RNA helicase